MLAIAIFLLFLLQTTTTRAQESLQAVFEIVNNSILLDETPFSERRSDSLASCSRQCTRDKRCKSANFIKSEEMCSLMDKTRRTHPPLFLKQVNTIHLQKINSDLGSTQELAVPLCNALSVSLHPSGLYWVDVDGGSHANAFKVYCEMETDGGSTQELAVPSCTALHPDLHPSGMYWVDVDGGAHDDAVKVYCETETDGGGWTLVWSYTFTDYDNFDASSNAVTPRPDWPAGSAVNVPVSTSPPANETDYNAMEFSLWKEFGKEFLIKSNINNWLVCSPDKGSLVKWKTGEVTCKIAKHVADPCSNGLPPSKFRGPTYCGPALLLESIGQYYYFDGCTAKGTPAHNPCIGGEDNRLRNVENPHGNIFVR